MPETNEREALRKRFFPRVPWTEKGPVRRRYMAGTADGDCSVPEALARLAEREGFTEPGQETVLGNAAETEAAFRKKADGGAVGMIFGTETDAVWCDIACGPAGAEGFCEMLVRSEEGENLTALAYCEGLLRFRRAES